jgi:6,7-dimethyl-8-ribityllumazine synthase
VKPEDARSELPQAGGARVGIVSARFYPELADWLEDGARRALAACGVGPDAWTLTRVAGSFELPLAARLLVETDRYDAIVALGAIVRGETSHFQFVCAECARGIMDVQLEARVPIGFGVLTTDTLEQAVERADPAQGDKGFHATVAALGLLGIDRRRGS